MFGQQQRILIRKEAGLGNTGGRSIKMWKLNYKHWLSYTQLKTLLGIKSIKVLKIVLVPIRIDFYTKHVQFGHLFKIIRTFQEVN